MVAVINWLKEAPTAFKSDGPSCNEIQSRMDASVSEKVALTKKMRVLKRFAIKITRKYIRPSLKKI
jgi:hypothetical protein